MTTKLNYAYRYYARIGILRERMEGKGGGIPLHEKRSNAYNFDAFVRAGKITEQWKRERGSYKIVEIIYHFYIYAK